MDKANKQVGAGSSSSSFTNDLFGPKETPKSSSSSSALFNSVFGPPSTGLRRDSVHTGVGGSSTMKNYQYGNAKYGTSGNGSQGSRGDISSKDKSSMYQNEKTEPSYLSSSIYYGGQDVYSPNSQPASQHILKKDGEDDDQKWKQFKLCFTRKLVAGITLLLKSYPPSISDLFLSIYRDGSGEIRTQYYIFT